MQLPTSAIQEFKSIWEQVSDEILDCDTAAVQAQKMLLAMETIFNNQSYEDTQPRTPVSTPVLLSKNKEPRVHHETLPN